MSSYTNFLNLFKWNPIDDSEEEFDIDKALNDNLDKIDTKLKDYITDTDNNINTFKTETNRSINTFKEETNTNISEFKESTNKTVQDLRDSISATQGTHKYKLTVSTTTSSGAEITLPCYYKVGQDVLDVYLEDERLIKSSDEAGTDGHYVEVGEADSISNKIKIATDWAVEAGMTFEFVVRGEYSV